jgi:hypothetical protein
MAEGRQRHDWSVASALMALIANTQRDPRKGRPLRASDFDPFAARRAPVMADVSVLKDVFIDGRVPAAVQEAQA